MVIAKSETTTHQLIHQLGGKMNIIEIPATKTVGRCPHISSTKCALFECDCKYDRAYDRAYGCSEKLFAEMLSGYEPGKMIFAKANGHEVWIRIKNPDMGIPVSAK